MKKSKIEWTEETWNPTTGCTKVSSGCKHCYAETMANRLKAMGTPGYENGFGFTMMPERLEQPLKKKKPTKYFVNSMSDGWVFNFKKVSVRKGKKTFVLVREKSPEIIEGCMIFSEHETFGPYMDLLEVAPQNKGTVGLYKQVAGCLIAYACGLSFEHGVKEDKGILTFQAFGKTNDAQEQLERLYREKYGAIKNPLGFMEIHPDTSKKLIEKYLNKGNI